LIDGKFHEREHKDFFTYFNWEQFSDEEWLLCPPVVALGGDGAMYDIGFQNLSRMMASGKPIKVIVVDTQVYSNTGGQACTSGFIGQVSDMAQYGKVWKGKPEPRKEIGLIALAHRNTYVMQGTLSNTSHMIEGFIDGLMAKRPALFNLYTTCQPEHGVADDLGVHQAKLAVESRAYPVFKYDPEKGKKIKESFDISGNPSINDTWPTYDLKYIENGYEKSMTLPMTFADFAITEARFRKHFRMVPRDNWNDNMVMLTEFLEMDESEREGKFPFIWAVNRKQQLNKVLVAKPIVESCEERRDFWLMIKDLAGVEETTIQEPNQEERIKAEVVSNIAKSLMKLADGDLNGSLNDVEIDLNGDHPKQKESENGQYIAPWLETEHCTSCDECININNKIFAYNEDKKAYIVDPLAGSYEDIVKAAEKCTAQVIHPGYPKDPGVEEKWILRAEKYN
jgi:pyruvate-ferredoxin/flavodoxin oxidoreductase